jgi:hypothetical protein
MNQSSPPSRRSVSKAARGGLGEGRGYMGCRAGAAHVEARQRLNRSFSGCTRPRGQRGRGPGALRSQSAQRERDRATNLIHLLIFDCATILLFARTR